MNKGLLQNSNVQQMITTINPSSLWNINNIMRPPFIPSSPSSSSSTTINNYLAPPPNNNNNYIINPNHSTNYTINNLFQVHQYNNMNMNMASYDDNHVQEQPPPFHESLSQLLLDGLLMGEEEKKMENWEEQIGLQQHHSLVEHLKQKNSLNSYNNNNNNNNYNNVYSTNEQEIKQVGKSTNWSSPHQISISSPQSCVSTNFIPVSDHSSECDSTPTSGALKKPKLQPSPSRSTFKVRKEKLGDRITALHQLVSPFGKTDTASVLLEAIGYVRFLHGQIEALSLPYLTNEAGNKRQPHIVQGEKKCIFPEDPGQLLHENCLKRKGGPDEDSYKEEKDLRSKGLCLVPLSCTVNVGTDNGADYWAPAISGGGFR